MNIKHNFVIKKTRQLVVVVSGQLNSLDEIEALDKYLFELNKEETDNFDEVVLDLTDINFISSSGIGIIVKQNARYLSNNKKMSIINCNQSVYNILVKMKINYIIDITKKSSE